jgi:hypothetical protein
MDGLPRATALRDDDVVGPLVRPYTSAMPPLSLPPLPPMARFLFGDVPEADAGHAPFEDFEADMDDGPKHRRPGPTLTAGPGKLPRHAHSATGRGHE